MIVPRLLTAFAILAALLTLATTRPSFSASGAAKNTALPKPAVQSALEIEKARPGGNTHWEYDGARGPDSWGGLSSTFKLCETGKRQSPIDLEKPGPARLEPLGIHYKLSVVELASGPQSVEGDYGKGSYVEIGGERYELTRFEFHAPSEHTVVGRQFPLEIQFYHQNAAGRVAVISVLATLGRDNLAAREIFERLPARAGGVISDPKILMNARDLLPDTGRFFRYAGSLTAPPCTENVDWFVMAEPVRLSEEQVSRVRGAVAGNARPVQPRNGRYLLLGVDG